MPPSESGDELDCLEVDDMSEKSSEEWYEALSEASGNSWEGPGGLGLLERLAAAVFSF